MKDQAYVPPTKKQMERIANQIHTLMDIVSSYLGGLQSGKIKAPNVLIIEKGAREYPRMTMYESIRRDLAKVGIEVPEQQETETPKRKKK